MLISAFVFISLKSAQLHSGRCVYASNRLYFPVYSIYVCVQVGRTLGPEKGDDPRLHV